MSGHIGYEVSKSQFGRVRLLPFNKATKTAAQKVAAALGQCLNANITYHRRGWFGPKVARLNYMGQTIEVLTDKDVLCLDLLDLDDEARETLMEMLRHSPLFIRI